MKCCGTCYQPIQSLQLLVEYYLVGKAAKLHAPFHLFQLPVVEVNNSMVRRCESTNMMPRIQKHLLSQSCQEKIAGLKLYSQFQESSFQGRKELSSMQCLLGRIGPATQVMSLAFTLQELCLPLQVCIGFLQCQLNSLKEVREQTSWHRGCAPHQELSQIYPIKVPAQISSFSDESANCVWRACMESSPLLQIYFFTFIT